MSIQSYYQALLDSLLENPQQGTPLGESLCKIKMPIASKGQGKSGGPRRAEQGLLRA